MASPIVHRKVAMSKQTHHQMVPGIGYIAHVGPPELPASANGSKNCSPAPGTKDGTIHMLKPPNGAPSMELRWVAGEQAWASTVAHRGNRLAWPVSHLSRAGWAYESAK